MKTESRVCVDWQPQTAHEAAPRLFIRVPQRDIKIFSMHKNILYKKLNSIVINLPDMSVYYLCRYFMNRDLHARIFLLAISFLFCFLFLWGFLFALIARAERVFIYTIREIYLAPKTFHKFSQLPPKSTARRSLKWPNEQRGRAAAAELSISQNVARLPISFSSSPSHSHSSFPSFSFSPFSPTPTQPKSLPYCTKSLHCFADAQCAYLRVERKWNACVWNASSAQKQQVAAQIA